MYIILLLLSVVCLSAIRAEEHDRRDDWQRDRRAKGSVEWSVERSGKDERQRRTTYRLHTDLLRGYHKRTRPVLHPDNSVKVSMSVFLYQVIHLDQVKNTVKLAGSFELYWQDQFLTWNPLDYEGADQIFLSSTKIWVPELSLYYSHHFNEEVVMRSNNDVRVNYTGHMRYYIPFTTESICPIDVQFFPFDEQRCQLFFGSWAHSNESISFKLWNNLSLIDFYDNQEWQLIEEQSDVREEPWMYDYMGEPLTWELIILRVSIKRQSFYYVFNLVIPSTIITVVAVVGFHTPSTSGRVRDAKFRLGIMTLMSMSVILLAIVEDMPKFALRVESGKRGSFSGIPLIGLYYFCLLCIIGMSTISTSLFVFLERNIRVHRSIPFWLRWIGFDCQGAFKYERANLDSSAGAESPPPPANAADLINKRFSVAQYDNLVLYQYFQHKVDDLTRCIGNIDASLNLIRHELLSLLPQDDLDNLWNKIIRRLELFSLFIYLSAILVVLLLFFYHDWYRSAFT